MTLDDTPHPPTPETSAVDARAEDVARPAGWEAHPTGGRRQGPHGQRPQSPPGRRPRHGFIEVRGAREHTLRNIDVDIPKLHLTVVTGVSGSGKSSLVFDTLAAESQRQLNATFSAFARNRLPSYGQPDVDRMAHLCAVTVVDQKRLGGGARSTVGTATDIGARLRLIFSRAGRPFAGYSNAFSFNDPQGMCPRCQGLGVVSVVDETQLVDRDRSLDDGGLTFPAFGVGGWFWRSYARSGFFDPSLPLREFSDEQWRIFMYAEQGELKAPNPDVTSYEGVVARFNRLYLHKEPDAYKGKAREAFERIVTRGVCPDCAGTRLAEGARSSLIDGRSIADLNALQADELAGVIRAIDDPSVAPLVADAADQVERLGILGLGYLSLDRATSTLSGGESQRVKMVRHLGSSLSDLLYVFDEPTVGLHPRDVHRLGSLLEELRDQGNTVVVVEHDPEIMAIADHCIDMGPGAGRAGGAVTYEGSYDGLVKSETRTGLGLRAARVTRDAGAVRTPSGHVRIEHASTHNLRDVTVDLPLGVLTVVTGVAGSGKSSLIRGHLPAVRPDAVLLDQSPVRGSRRSSPATFTGVLDPIRSLFARTTGAPAALFSPNSDGGCPECQGAGVIFTDLAFMDGVTTMCEVCRGRRFKDEAQQHLVRGRSIADVFELSVAEALEFFTEKAIRPTLQRLSDVGLDYLTLGQTLTTLSGGERQRLKLASELVVGGKFYVLDEPTTGLHLADVEHLVALLHRLVDDGNTVIVIEHNLDVVVAADWVIDLGPGAGHDGGRVVFEGTPAALAADGSTYTGEYLARYLAD
ncbi:ATP-binding cassette domain-containing protein [Jiangella alba]|uniref:UvrABC system protein A n=1 Tax=Jiangella alba TaxID=561176 RepID=A0A1H5PQQ6_9ACTN|nr:excinuclease ABC subunit UvrA [Jiangella alba]SEF16059.1 excinuclease ABC, A subunit [Jiangella alba]